MPSVYGWRATVLFGDGTRILGHLYPTRVGALWSLRRLTPRRRTYDMRGLEMLDIGRSWCAPPVIVCFYPNKDAK